MLKGQLCFFSSNPLEQMLLLNTIKVNYEENGILKSHSKHSSYFLLVDSLDIKLFGWMAQNCLKSLVCILISWEMGPGSYTTLWLAPIKITEGKV